MSTAKMLISRVQLTCDGTWRRTGGETGEWSG